MDNELRKCADASDRSSEADVEVQILRCEERRGVAEVQRETKASAGDQRGSQRGRG